MTNAFLIYGIELFSFIALYASSYYYDWHYQISLYGIIMLGYFCTQQISSYLNLRNYKRIANSPTPLASLKDRFIVLLIVGHRENPIYWKKCLQSVADLECDQLKSVYIVVDGNEEEDKIMYDTAKEFFDENNLYNVKVNIQMVYKRGKRGVMCHGFQKIRHDYFDIPDTIIDVAVTDSDTILEPSSLVRLQECLHSDPRNGCATGSLYVFNTDYILTRVINARYAYAFNIERACASYFGCMSCCSGPLSMYRLDVLDETILQRFVTQSILGVKCEPGDDRHLTNLVMAKGYLSRQTQLSTAGTEAPEYLFRYILQQMRWNRSFYRELRWQIQSIPSHHFILHFISIYELTFPWFVLTWSCFVLFKRASLELLLDSFAYSVLIMLVRTIFISLSLKQNMLLYGILYYIMYFTMLLPLKIFSLFTVLNNTWVTPSRHQMFKCLPSCSLDAKLAILFIAAWNVVVAYGITNTIVNSYTN
jgi:cellulose synthase/poly-beta-1,6-N-acetylglucosamine synthase-like glycosyltransferase